MKAHRTGAMTPKNKALSPARKIRYGLLLALPLMAAPAFADGPQFCQHINLGGRCFDASDFGEPFKDNCYSVPDLRRYSFNDEMSSVYVPDGWQVRLYEDINYSGATLDYSSSPSLNNLTDQWTSAGKSWNDRVSSFEACASSTDDGTDSSPMPHGPQGNWTLKFRDEFDEDTLNTTRWAPCWFDTGSEMCGSVQPEGGVYTYKKNVRIENGNLILTLSAPTEGAAVTTDTRSGATKGYQFTTGVVEARIFFPGDKNGVCYNWPAWWTDGKTWPGDGENDIAEVLNGQITFNYHSARGNYNFGSVGARCGEWHIYTLNRQATYSEVYLDGQLVKNQYHNGHYATNDSGKPQYLILNVAYDKNHVMTGPAGEVKVDWVRAWQ